MHATSTLLKQTQTQAHTGYARHVTTDLLVQLDTYSVLEGMSINGYQRVCVGVVDIARCSSSAVDLLI
jgi:hypothetical protein